MPSNYAWGFVRGRFDHGWFFQGWIVRSHTIDPAKKRSGHSTSASGVQACYTEWKKITSTILLNLSIRWCFDGPRCLRGCPELDLHDAQRLQQLSDSYTSVRCCSSSSLKGSGVHVCNSYTRLVALLIDYNLIPREKYSDQEFRCPRDSVSKWGFG